MSVGTPHLTGPESGKGTRGGRKGPNGWGYTRSWVVEAARTDSEYAVLAATGVPDYGDPHPDDPGAICTNVEVHNVEGDIKWTIVAQYEPIVTGLVTDNPTNDDPEIEITHERVTQVVERDSGGNRIENSAGDRILVEDDSYRPVIRIVRNEASAPAAGSYVGTVNSGNMTIAGETVNARCGLMRRLNPREQQDADGDDYWRVTYEIVVRTATWDRVMVDQGFRAIFAGNLREIRQSDINADIEVDGPNDTPVREPQPLNANGTLRVAGAPLTLTFQTKTALDWSPLSLPS